MNKEGKKAGILEELKGWLKAFAIVVAIGVLTFGLGMFFGAGFKHAMNDFVYTTVLEVVSKEEHSGD